MRDVIIRHGEPAVRPDDVAGAIDGFGRLARGGAAAIDGFGRPEGRAAAMVRLAQGPLMDGGAVGDPFASVRG
jgi:hypothetical protein